MTTPVGGRLVSKGAWSTVGSVSASAAVMVASVVTARILGPSQFGRYVYAVFLYATAAQVAVWGLPGAVTRFIAVAVARTDRADERAVVARSIAVGALGTLAAAASLVGLAAAGLVPRSATSVLAAGVVLALAPTQLVISILTGREAFRRLALWQLVVGAVNPALTIVVLVLGGGVVAVLVVDAAVTAAGLLVLVNLSRPLWLTTERPAPEGFWRFASAYAVLILLGIVVFQRSEIVVLEALRSNRAVALYGVAFGVSQLVPRLTGPALGVLTPAFARMQAVPDDTLRRAVQGALNVAVVLGVALSCLGVTLGPALVRLLYGARYTGAGAATAVLLSMSWLVLVSAVITPVAQGGAHMRFLVWLNGSAAVLNIAAAIVLVELAGVIGAAIANVAAQSLVALGLVLWLRRRMPELSFAGLLRVLPAAVVAVALGLVASWFPPVVALVLGAVLVLPAYLYVARATRAIDDAMLDLIPARLRSRLRLSR